MAAVIVDDIMRCEGCGAHYGLLLARRLRSPDPRRWCIEECSRRRPTRAEASRGAFIQRCLDQLCAKNGSAEWDKLLPAQRVKVWAQLVLQYNLFKHEDLMTSAPRREPVIRGHSTGL
jgi:hypothetical protein